jgi:hypothetical protein
MLCRTLGLSHQEEASMDVRLLIRQALLVGPVAIVALGLAACGPAAASDTTPTGEAQLGVQNASATPASPSGPTTLPAATQPISPTATAPAQAAGPQQIFIDSPAPGTLVGSPAQVSGRTLRMPVGGQLGYQVIGANGQVIGSGNLLVGAAAGGGAFNTPLTFTLPQNGGTVTARLFETVADGTQAAVSSLDMFVQSQVQSITIDTPAPGTQVGSPMVLTGQLARPPNQNRLYYWVKNSAQQQIGAGSFDVVGAPGLPTGYVGSLFFDLPFDGDTIGVQIYDQDPASGAIVAAAPINLHVAPVPQQITIDSPPPGRLVGSPMTVTGRTVRFPANGALTYRVTNAAGAQIGAGSFPVGGAGGAGSQFTAQAAFSVPRDGGLIRLTIADQNTPNGVVESAIELDVLAQYQAIAIDTPAPGTRVGSPMTLSGRTNWHPNNGQLLYRVLDAGNATIGSGVVRVAGAPGGRGSFNAQLVFAEPPNGGNIRAELVDQAGGGAVVAVATIQLTVAPPPPPQILIDTPPPGTQVGSPMTLTGRTTYVPSGQLSYRVRDAASNVIGQGGVAVAAGGRQGSFNAQLSFTEPAAGGNIVVEIFGPGPAAGAPPISTSIMLYVAPRR